MSQTHQFGATAPGSGIYYVTSTAQTGADTTANPPVTWTILDGDSKAPYAYPVYVQGSFSIQYQPPPPTVPGGPGATVGVVSISFTFSSALTRVTAFQHVNENTGTNDLIVSYPIPDGSGGYQQVTHDYQDFFTTGGAVNFNYAIETSPSSGEAITYGSTMTNIFSPSAVGTWQTQLSYSFSETLSTSP